MAPAKRKAQVEAPEPEETEAEEVLEPSPRYILFAEWLEEELGLELDPLTLEIGQKNYGKFQRSDLNRENNIRLRQEKEEERAKRQEAAEQRRQAAAEKREAAQKAREEKAEQEKSRKASAPAEGKATAVARKGGSTTKKAAPAATKTVGKARATRSKSAASPF